ncbi:DUF1572 family protein [Cohnella cholangitidis]|uniref:DUF1572 domain-containing protein n=1 Tax=Cohnella cholangitidis TaxID=2598458 RepID=A0A7G5BU20_9BACL|nr:DUF1572 family protein [Cohnella cholangitidis]QMV40454.1 DUF1572 domain-containing protein [Cohnella cholangitidis]
MSEHDLAKHLLETSIADFRSQKSLGDRALAQIGQEGIGWSPDPGSNSIAIIVKHVSGNMISRWTDFLTTDGEKPDRNRDDEFEDDIGNLRQLTEIWEKGWAVLFDSLEQLNPEDVLRTVTIRGQSLTVLQAIHRQISHYGYHVGQIVYLAKANKTAVWQTLSIAKGGSAEFNDKMKER